MKGVSLMKEETNKLQLILDKQKIIKEQEKNLQQLCQEMTDSLNDITLTELVGETSYKVNVYPIKTDGAKIVLLQPQSMPDCALAVFDLHQTSTQWQVYFRLAEGVKSRRYSVMCACCPTYRYGLEAPCEDSESSDYKQWDSELKGILLGNLTKVCREYGINKVYMRRAASFYEKYCVDKSRFEIFIIEANAIVESQKFNYLREKIEEAWEFVDWKQTTFKLR